MRRVVSIFGLCAAVLVLGILLERRGVLRTTVDHATAPSTAAPSRVGVENDPSEQVVDLASVPPTSPREAVPLLEPTSVTEDPCASVTAELQAALAANEVAAKEIRELREKLAEVTRELNALQFPDDTPYGAFLASPEAKDITDPQLLVAFKALLDDFPVMLRPGEATWIAEHSREKEWGAYAYPNERQLVYFLGPERLAAEIPLDKLFEDYLWNDDYGPALQAALPPEKRAELNDKLKSIVQTSNDPEEVAWLLEKYPSFFE